MKPSPRAARFATGAILASALICAAPAAVVCAHAGESDSLVPEQAPGVDATTGSAKVAVYAGYYDTHHTGHKQTKPSPWKGSSNVVFVGKPDGSSGGWDTSAIRVDNLTSSSLTVSLTVDIGSKHFARWTSQSIGGGKTLIFAQTAFENFDGSDTNPAGCYGCSSSLCVSKVLKTIPVVHVTVSGTRTDYYDTYQVLNTRGVDAAGCPYTGTRNDESHAWQQISSSSSAAALATALNASPENVFEAPMLSLGVPYPNPTRDAIDFEFRTPQDGPVRLAVYDVSGRLVREELDQVLEGGFYHVHLDLAGARAGIYYCSLVTPTGTARSRFVLVR